MTIVTEAFTDYTGTWMHALLLGSVIVLFASLIFGLISFAAEEWMIGLILTLLALLSFGGAWFSIDTTSNLRESRHEELETQLTDAGFENLDVDYAEKSFTGSKDGEYVQCGFLLVDDDNYQLACNPAL